MKYKPKSFAPRLAIIRQLSWAALAAVFVLALPVASNAQQTSSGLRGSVTDADGAPIAGASVVIVNEKTGLTRSATTNASGVYHIRNLPIDHNYTVTATADGYGSLRDDNVSIQLGRIAQSNFPMQAAAAIEEIVVMGQQMTSAYTATGPNATFDLNALEDMPSINRNITDVLRADPRVYVDESRGTINAVQCAGKNNRFNSLTVDGVRMNDSFGLNANGYPTERQPFPYDAIQQISVELSPFDVEYGGFSACSINSVTKSGGNDFSGGAFYDYTDDGLRSDRLEGDTIRSGAYEEKRYGFHFGGPIIRDRLFFHVTYEKLEGANLFDRGPLGSGAVNAIDISQEDLNRIRNIAMNNYQYDPGPIPSSIPHEDEKLLVKFDWNLSDTQRLALTYNYNDGENFRESDSDQNEFEFENHLYERGAELNMYVGSLYSDWTDNFSTQVRVSYLELDNRQIPVGGLDFGEIRVETPDVDVYLGADDSRSANKLNYDVTSISAKGNYYMGDHVLSFGVENESLEIFNMFVQHVLTEVRFDGIDNFEQGFADAIYYNNAPSQDPRDAAALWGYDANSVFLQDEWQASDRLTLVFGLRYDWYTTSDKPEENSDFLSDYGFSNSQTLDGKGLVQPRFGFEYDMSDRTKFHGGLGLYSGGNPNVWLSNTYSANNVLQFGQRGRSFGYTDGSRSLFDSDVQYVQVYGPDAGGAAIGPGYGVPSELYDAVGNGVGDNFEINYLDPNFDIPSEWKLALGVVHDISDEMRFYADLLYSRGMDGAMVKHADLEQIGTNPDGYPEYDSVREPSFVLTNSGQTANATVLSFRLDKSFGENLDLTVGYSHTDSEDVQPMTSSVAFSNYQNRAFFDPEEDVLSPSNYQIEHRFSATLRYRREIGATTLRAALYGSANSGRPYSLTYDGTFDPYGGTPWLDFNDNVLQPENTRNQFTGSYWRKLDARVSLDFPGFGDNHFAQVFLVIDNLTNLLNDDWGVLYQHNFPRTVTPGTRESRLGDASRYEVRFGVKYRFE